MTGETSGASAPPATSAEPEPRRATPRFKGTLRGAVIGLVAAVLAAAAAHLPLIDTWERPTLDLRVRAFARPERADPAIVAVVIDQKSLDAITAPREQGGLEQGWLWPRDFHAAVLRYLLDAGARAVAFNLVISETSIYTRLGIVDDDEDLARAGGGPARHPRRVVHSRAAHRAGSASPGAAAGRPAEPQRFTQAMAAGQPRPAGPTRRRGPDARGLPLAEGRVARASLEVTRRPAIGRVPSASGSLRRT